MAITANCPGCGKVLKLRDEMAGKKGKCPDCGGIIEVPATASAAQTPEPISISSDPPVDPPAESIGGEIPGPVEDRIPWERRKEIGFVRAFFLTFKEVLFTPTNFFERMGTEGGIGEPLLFTVSYSVLVTGLLAMLMGGLFLLGTLTAGASGAPSGEGMAAAGVGFGIIMVFYLVLIPVSVIANLFILSGIRHLCLMIIKGANTSFETTLRVIAYSHSAQIIPVAGTIWFLVCEIIGLSTVNGISGGKAALSVFLPAIAFVVLCCGGYSAMIILAMLLGGAQA